MSSHRSETASIPYRRHSCWPSPPMTSHTWLVTRVLEAAACVGCLSLTVGLGRTMATMTLSVTHRAWPLSVSVTDLALRMRRDWVTHGGCQWFTRSVCHCPRIPWMEWRVRASLSSSCLHGWCILQRATCKNCGGDLGVLGYPSLRIFFWSRRRRPRQMNVSFAVHPTQFIRPGYSTHMASWSPGQVYHNSAGSRVWVWSSSHRSMHSILRSHLGYPPLKCVGALTSWLPRRRDQRKHHRITVSFSIVFWCHGSCLMSSGVAIPPGSSDSCD